MYDEVSRAERNAACADRFGSALGRSGVADERANGHRERYERASAELGAYQRAVANAYNEMGVRIGKRLRLQPLANRTYRLARRYQGEKLYRELAECVQDRLVEGLGWVEILAVVEKGMGALGLPFNLEEANELRRVVGAKQEGRAVSENEVSSPGPQVDKFVDTEVKRAKRQMRESGELSFDKLVADDTEWESERRKLAMRNLKLALAGHHKIVKQVVARRLCEQRSYDELATMFEITREDVAAILDKMRVWVNRFTAYFADEFYWKDGGQKFIMPSH